MKIKETARLDLYVRLNSDFNQSEILLLDSKPSRKGKIMQGQQKVPLTPVLDKKAVNVGKGKKEKALKQRIGI